MLRRREMSVEQSYFVDLEQDKAIKVGVSPFVSKISPKVSSHRAAWAFLIANQLVNAGYENTTVLTGKCDDWSEFDVVLLYLGMEYDGNGLNLYDRGEVLDQRLSRLFTPNVRLYVLDYALPESRRFLRFDCTDRPLAKELLSRKEEIEQLTSSVPVVHHIAKTKSLCFGDSHSFSQYTPGYMTSRNDGLTLYGALKKSLRTYVPEHIEELRIYLGNIDIRHHLARQEKWQTAVCDLVAEYESQLKELQETGVSKIEVVQALPIENESRKLPKTGYYKGTPFFGTWEERTLIAEKFNQLVVRMCDRNGWATVDTPYIYMNFEDELKFEVMEKPRSVHMSREYYRWDLVRNESNRALGGHYDGTN
jgi:hypothetical protein